MDFSSDILQALNEKFSFQGKGVSCLIITKICTSFISCYIEEVYKVSENKRYHKTLSLNI